MSKLTSKQNAESFVFVNEEQQQLRYRPVVKGSLQVRSHTDDRHPDNRTFIEGEDFVVRYETGWIYRTAGSRIPDWQEHVLYGVQDFDHTLFGDYSNRAFTVYADYEYEREQSDASHEIEANGDGGNYVLAGVKSKLQRGQEITYVVYGDSISKGGEASEERFAYYQRFSKHLASLHPYGSICVVNKAIGGETSEGGAGRAEQDIVSHRPDLVTIGYGMNDQNKFDPKKNDFRKGVSLDEYEANIRHIIETIRYHCDADIVLVTPCQPNPFWQHTSGQIGKYAEVLRCLGREFGIGIADAYAIWQRELDAGKTPESLLLNNINHPNDYGHWLYYKAFEVMLAKL